MKLVNRKFNDILLLRPRLGGDETKHLSTWSYRDLSLLGITTPFVQENHSFSKCNVLRGLHYQIKHPQGKLIMVFSGTIYDVVVDMRRSSPYFGRYAGFELSASSSLSLWIPPGYAHGYYVISEESVVLYSVTDYRFAEHERTLCWNDEHLNISWPFGVEQPLISDKDRCGVPFADADYYP